MFAIVQAELRQLTSPDVPCLKAYRPAEGAFSILVRASVGPAGAEGEESFDFIVCSPQWLASEAARWGIVTGRHKLVMNTFNHDVLEGHIRKLIAHAGGADWNEVGQRLARWASWEFEDYQP